MKVVPIIVAFLLVLATAGLGASAPKNGTSMIVWADNELLIGSVVDGKLLTYKEAADRLEGSEIYKLYSLTRYLGKATGTKIKSIEANYCILELSSTAKIPENTIGICAKWNAMPRRPRIQSTKQQVYIDAARDVLKENGLENVPVNITQVIKVDLEGDGTDEVLVSATCPNPDYFFSVKKGDYSFVILRKVLGKKVQTFFLGGEFYTKEIGPDDTPRPFLYKVFSVLDVDGDGKMEIVLKVRYIEGDFFQFIKVGRTGFDVLGTALLGV